MPSCLFRNVLFLLPHQAAPQFHSRAPSLNVWPCPWLHPSFLLIFFLSLDTDNSKYPPPALIFPDPDLKSSSRVSHQPLRLNMIKRELSMVTTAASHLRTSPSIPPSLSRPTASLSYIITEKMKWRKSPAALMPFRFCFLPH